MKPIEVCRRRALIACAGMLATLAPSAALAAPDDPWEPANRTFYMVYRVLDDAVFSKLAAAFKVIPEPIRTVARNVISNLTEPGVAANDLLQGHPKTAARTVMRFVANSSVGFAGAIDVAGENGIKHHDNNFADTFGRWGAPAGPYLFIPFVGPTTVRDGLGMGTDILTDPFTWSRFEHRWTVIDVRAVWGGLDQRAEAGPELQAINNMSTDPYASLRSLYLQNRAAVIASPPDAEPNAGAAPLPALPDFDVPGSAPPPATPGPSDSPPPPAAPPGPAAEAKPSTPPLAEIGQPPSPDAPIATWRRA